MAVTIVRTAWIDDDGTGTTGTVINNAVKTGLYNEIDGALAKVAQLAGANTFTGTQTVPALASTSFLPFQTAGTERLRIAATGEVLIGTTSTFQSPRIAIVSDLSVTNAIILTNTNAGNSGNFLMFVNSVGALAGSIAHAGAGAVVYGTTSDARLKDDAGRAADLTALRAVVVHDFAWKADGRTDRGVFAQEAHALFPNAILPGTDETTDEGSLARPWMTDYSKFVPDLIVGWQQHDADLAEIRALLAAVKG